MQTRTKSGDLPPPVLPAAEAAFTREAVVAALLASGAGTEEILAWIAVELARQGDLIDRLTNLLPAAEAAAARLAHPIRGAFGRGGQAAAVNMTGGKPR
jgi:hypothetical protein